MIHGENVPKEEENFISFRDAPVSQILDLYELLSSKHLIREASVNDAPRINLSSHGLNNADTIKLIESTLMLNGLVLVPIDDITIKIMLSGQVKNARSEGARLFVNPADFPEGEEVISYYMSLKFITPQEASELFMKHAPPHPYGSYVAAPSARAVILTESTNTIRQLISLQKMVDVPPSPLETQFVTLHYSDAIKMADMVNTLLGLNKASTPFSTPGTQINSIGEGDFLVGQTQIEADPQSNRLVVVTRNLNMTLINELVARLDEPGTSTAPRRRELRFVQAIDILPALQSTLAQGLEEVSEAKSHQKEIVEKKEIESKRTTSGSSPSELINNSGEPSNSNNAALTPNLKEPRDHSAPEFITVGRTRLVADSQSNSIIVYGSEDAVAKVFKMIGELDRKPLQVFLATIIGQLTISKGSEFGVDLLQKYSHTGKTGVATSSITNPGTASTTNLPDPTSLTSTMGFPINAGLNLYGVIGNRVNSYIRALENTNRFQVISRPSVFTTNNKLAVIASGSQIPVPSTTTSGVTGAGNNLVTTSNIQYQNVLLRLEIIPLINADHEITLKIRQTNNSVGASQTISGNAIPSIITQEINTEVTLQNQSTVVIGGLISDSKTKTTSGIPWLSSIPLLGNLFKDTSTNDQRNELIIMIQPTVIETASEGLAASEDQKRRALIQSDLNNTLNNIPLTNLARKSKTIDSVKARELPGR